MTTFINTLNIWNSSINKAIRTGQIKLQRGQWLICGSNNDKRCRYVGHTKKTIDVVHWQGNSKATMIKFDQRVKAYTSSYLIRGNRV